MYYHVYIIIEGGPDWAENDLTIDELKKRILEPYNQGKRFVSSGYSVDPKNIRRIQISQTIRPAKDVLPIIRLRNARSSVVAITSPEFKVFNFGEEVTKKFITEPHPLNTKDGSSTTPLHSFARNQKIQGTLVVIILYFIVGTFLYSTNTSFYNYFEDKEFSINPDNSDKELYYSIHNKSPLTLPMVNSYYGVKIIIKNNYNNTFAYFKSGSRSVNFTDYYLDVGIIQPGKEFRDSFYLHLGKENSEFKTVVYYSILNRIRIPIISQSYSINYLGNNVYQIIEIS